MARRRSRFALSEIKQVLRPLGLEVRSGSEADFDQIAQFVEAWDSIEQYVEFEAVVARCHWHMLCSPVCRTARQRSKRVITFQQGVIDHTLDVPVTASRYVAFGPSSANLLANMNRSFYNAVGLNESPPAFVEGGSLFDTVIHLPDQFSKRSLLVILDSDDYSFYGIENPNDKLLQLVERVLKSAAGLSRVTIRPRPDSDNGQLQRWKLLAGEYPGTCEISHPGWSLEEDLHRASAVLGYWSGTLTVAAASGLPTFFLEPDCYTTRDLACFNEQTFPSDDALREITRVLSDPGAYAVARRAAFRNAREYYANGSNLELDAAFFQRLLHSETPRTLPTTETSHRSAQEVQALS